MPSHTKKEAFRPFKDLGRLIKHHNMELKKEPCRAAPPPAEPLSAQQEARLFREAMADVTPLPCNRHWQLPKRRLSFEAIRNEEERHAVDALYRLIDTGQGFTVADTPEYMEATSPGTDRRIARQLHQGRFSVQAHIDLHGLDTREAEGAIHTFLRKSIRRGRRAVLVVHGRGLASPRQPVLKNKVYHWLTRGPLRKYVIAFTSARSCDGGAGATYVLLRTRPATKKMRKS